MVLTHFTSWNATIGLLPVLLSLKPEIVKYRLIFFFLLLLMFAGIPVIAQNLPKSFSNDTVKFNLEMSQYFESIYDKDQRKEGKELMEKFTAAWNAGLFSHQRQLKIMDMSNKMLKYKMRPIPHYFQFLSAVLAYHEIQPEESSVNAWFAAAVNSWLSLTYRISSSRKMSFSIQGQHCGKPVTTTTAFHMTAYPMSPFPRLT
jgi:hypothetical protein